MNVSIAIATHNRAGELDRTLQSLLRLDPGAAGEDYEIIVIDNGSTDRTAELVQRAARSFNGRLRYVHEPQLGLSFARNRGVAESRFEIVSFLDDDVDVDSKWLIAVRGAFASGDWAAVGGKALLSFPVERPHWLSERTSGMLTRVDLGPQRRVAQADELYGVNFSFRRDWLLKTEGFRTDIGRVGTRLLSGEDTQMLLSVERVGGRLLYDPFSVVEHRVPLGRLRRRWFWSRCYWGGRTIALELSESELSLETMARATWHVVRESVVAARDLCRYGPASSGFFDTTTKLTAKWGKWIGLSRRICVRST